MHWKRPYWVEGELWWMGSIVLSAVCFSNWLLVAYFLAPSYAPLETLDARGWAVPLFMCTGWSFTFGIILGHASEKIYERSLDSRRRAKKQYLIAGFAGAALFGTATYLSGRYISPFSPFTFATIGPLIWTMFLILAGVSLRD